MRFNKLKNTLGRQRAQGIRLYQGCCCCCSSCILTPVGIVLAEAAVKSSVKHKVSIWKATGYNILALFLSCLVAGVIGGAFSPAVLLVLPIYYFFLSIFSDKWLETKDEELETKVVRMENFFSWILSSIFFWISPRTWGSLSLRRSRLANLPLDMLLLWGWDAIFLQWSLSKRLCWKMHYAGCL